MAGIKTSELNKKTVAYLNNSHSIVDFKVFLQQDDQSLQNIGGEHLPISDEPLEILVDRGLAYFISYLIGSDRKRYKIFEKSKNWCKQVAMKNVTVVEYSEGGGVFRRRFVKIKLKYSLEELEETLGRRYTLLVEAKTI
ncbi:MAG: hypothetical protein WC595_05870 [Candidatus Nanoarchaeia archaeon]